MGNEIIYLGYLPLTQKTADDFCMFILSKQGYHVAYWDLSTLFFKRIVSLDIGLVGDLEIVNVYTYSKLEELIKKHSNSLYIILISFSGALFRLFFYLNKYGCKTMTFNLCSIPFYLLYKKESFLHKLLRIRVKTVVNKLNYKLMCFLIRHQHMRYFDYILASGNLGNTYVGEIVKGNLACLRNTQILSFNTTDYNIFINNKYKSLALGYSYILFIDQYYPFHPDVLLFYGKSKMDSGLYFKQLNDTFNVIEKKYSMPVVIAAHPKAIKYREKDFFYGRAVFFGKTADLVRECKFVLSHDSTALNYAIFNMKPIVLLKSELIRETLPNNYGIISNLAKFLDAYLYDMDDLDFSSLLNDIKLSDEQRELYTSLIEKYHKAKNVTQSNETLIVQYVEQIFN